MILAIEVLSGDFEVSEGAGKIRTQPGGCAFSMIFLFELIKKSYITSPYTSHPALTVAHPKKVVSGDPRGK